MSTISREHTVPRSSSSTVRTSGGRKQTTRVAAAKSRRRAWRVDTLVILGSLTFTVCLFVLGALLLHVG
ncbi:MAG: hypothetical protein JWO63_913 [Frankiales bacterium]|jgi:hypothetical protein|nr:hypothetical protein [Frankiales bacterium]